MLTLQAGAWEKLIEDLKRQGKIRSSRVAESMRKVPRAAFLPIELQDYAASDTPLQIGFGQTVSAPHMVGIMNEALQLEVGQKVLEVGAGSGWNAAVMAEIVAPLDAPYSERGHVYTFEVVRSLAEKAKRNIIKAGYGDRVTVISGDGSIGYSQRSPFDRVSVAAAAAKIPKPLLEQLKMGGILLIPVGFPSLFQSLMKVTKQPDGKVKEENLGGVAFVPLTGQNGFK